MDAAKRLLEGRIYGPRGEVVRTYLRPSPLLPVIEALSRSNGYLRDVLWRKRIFPVLDAGGHEIFLDVEEHK